MGLAILDVVGNTNIGNTQRYDTCCKYQDLNKGIAVVFGGLFFIALCQGNAYITYNTNARGTGKKSSRLMEPQPHWGRH